MSMSEDEARAWLDMNLGVSRETVATLEALIAATVAENEAQNLIARSTIDHFWARHIVDSAQLLPLAERDGAWADLGAGAGFPGLVVALLTKRPVTLIEVRRKRADHLHAMIEHLGLGTRVKVLQGKVEQAKPPQQAGAFAVISARAYAPLDRLLESAIHLADRKTRWVLPKGRGAASELEAIAGSWQGSFRIEPSVTDDEAAIIVASGVARGKRS